MPAAVQVHDVDTPTSPSLDRVVFVAAGGRHSCAMVSHAGCMLVRSTGDNAYGQLGHGDEEGRMRCASLLIFEDSVPDYQ